MKEQVFKDLAKECGFDMYKRERVIKLENEIHELDEQLFLYNMNKPKIKEMCEEIADVYITSRLLCIALGVDFDEIVKDKINNDILPRYKKEVE